MKNQHKKDICCICKKSFLYKDLFPSAMVRSTTAEYIKQQYPDWNGEGWICFSDLRKYRTEHLRDFLLQEKGKLSDLDKDVLQSIQDQDLITLDTSPELVEKLTFAQKLSDKIAHFGGSWKFICIFISVMLFWMVLNSFLLVKNIFDPYPFILLNLVLSCLAAIQAPIIMMSQNRQSFKDRLRDNDDYRINLKTELEMRHLHAKLDVFMKSLWERIMEMYRIQLDMIEELVEENDNETKGQ